MAVTESRGHPAGVGFMSVNEIREHSAGLGCRNRPAGTGGERHIDRVWRDIAAHHGVHALQCSQVQQAWKENEVQCTGTEFRVQTSSFRRGGLPHCCNAGMKGRSDQRIMVQHECKQP